MTSRWSVVGSFALLGVATQVCWLSYAPITTASAARFGVSEQAVGWLANVFPLLFVLLAIPAGRALDRWLRPALAVGAVLVAVGAVTRSLVDGYTAALVGQTLVAVAQPVLANAITRVAAGYLAAKDRPLGIAIGAGATYVGMIAAIGIGTAFPTDVPLAVGLGTSVAVVASVIALVALRVSPPFAAAREPVVVLASAWRVPGVPLLAAVVFLCTGVFVSLATWLEPLLAPAGHDTGLLMLVILVAGVIGCAVVPPFAARGSREALVLRLTSAVTALACLVFAVGPGELVGFVVVVPIGFLLLTALPTALSLVERGGSASAGTITSVLWLCANGGGVVVSFMVGYLLDAPEVAFGLFTAIAVAALVCARRLETSDRAVRQPG